MKIKKIIKIRKNIVIAIFIISFLHSQQKASVLLPSTFDEIMTQFQNDAETLNQSFEKRIRIANEGSNISKLKILSQEEYNIQSKIFFDFFGCPNTIENLLKNARSILENITNGSQHRKLNEKFENKYELASIPQTYFFNLKIAIKDANSWQKVKNLKIEGDRHCATKWSDDSTFFLGDISDRGLYLSENEEHRNKPESKASASIILECEEEEIDKENTQLSEESFFYLEKTLYLIFRNLTFHIDGLNSLGNGTWLKEDKFRFLSVLGNHDFGSLLHKDLIKQFINQNFTIIDIETDEWHDLIFLLDHSMRCFIPTQMMLYHENEYIVMSHSGGELLLPDNTEVQRFHSCKEYESETFEYDFSDKKVCNKVAHLKKILTEESLQFLKFFDLIAKKSNINPLPWCDLFDEKDDISESGGRFSVPLGYIPLFNKITVINYNIPLPSMKYCIRCRAHEHTPEKLQKYFISKNKNYYIYEINNNNNNNNTKIIYLPPAYPIENQYCGEAIKESQIKFLEFLTGDTRTIKFLLNEKIDNIDTEPLRPLHQEKSYFFLKDTLPFDLLFNEEDAEFCSILIPFFDYLSSYIDINKNRPTSVNKNSLFIKMFQAENIREIALSIFQEYSFLFDNETIENIINNIDKTLNDKDTNINYKKSLVYHYILYIYLIEKLKIAGIKEIEKLKIAEIEKIEKENEQEIKKIKDQINTLIEKIQEPKTKEKTSNKKQERKEQAPEIKKSIKTKIIITPTTILIIASIIYFIYRKPINTFIQKYFYKIFSKEIKT